MQRIVNKANNFNEAEVYDIMQHINMTPEERQRIAKKLKDHFYFGKRVDVRESRVCVVLNK